MDLEAQRKAVEDFLNGGSWKLAKEFVEVESGKRADRPVLAEVIKACRLCGDCQAGSAEPQRALSVGSRESRC